MANCRFLVGGRGNLLLPVVAVENAGGLSAASVLPRPARRVDDRLWPWQTFGRHVFRKGSTVAKLFPCGTGTGLFQPSVA